MSSVIRESQRTSAAAQTVPVTVLLAPGMRDKLERLAAEAERSLGGEVRVALREHLAKAADGQGAA